MTFLGPWPKLKMVSIDIYTEIYSVFGDGDGTKESEYEINLAIDEFKPRLRNLPQNWLPMLLERSGKDLEFKFAVHPSS